MAKSSISIVQFRRKRKGRTDYRKRMNLLKSGKPRIAVRKSLNNIIVQAVEYSPSGDRVLASAHSSELKKIGWKAGCGNVPAAYLTGYLLGKKAGNKKISECVADTGLYRSVKGSRIYAALKGAADAGLKVPVSEEIAPAHDRISGKSIAEFAKKAKEMNSSQFSKTSPEGITKQFEDVKSRIEGM